jgi:mRNA-degrading endonuclease RelE of RelBE toxin-antitoxin system
MSSVDWNDWLTDSFFRIKVSTAAAAKLRALPRETQLRLRQMLQDIAELADLAPYGTAASWRAGRSPLLQLQVGRVCVRYSISEETRTLSVEHVTAPDEDELERAG